MINDFLKEKILSQFGFQPTSSQSRSIDLMVRFLTEPQSHSAFILRGYAGTGKTTLVRAIIQVLNELGQRSILLAPTGRAAKVLSNSIGIPAYTIHKKIYRQKSSRDGFAAFALDRNLHKNALFVVDEASMIANDGGGGFFGSGRLLDDLVNFVYQGENCRLLLIGDDAQLPPVGTDYSPALETGNLEAFGCDVYSAVLTHVVRQKNDSGILFNATRLRNMLDESIGSIGFPKFRTHGFTDVFRISGAALTEELDYCYNHYGLEETLVVCRTNKRANLYNQGIRNTILFREEQLSVGDYLLIMKNNYHWLKDHKEVNFIANGDIAEVSRILKYQNLYGYHFADVVLRLVDYKEIEFDTRIILDSLMTPGAGLNREEQEKFFYEVKNDYQEVADAKKQYQQTRENDFYNALQVKFAYAMTCHKSQGGQWKAVFVDLGYFTEDYLSRDLLRWLYTAITRATDRLYLVNFPDSFFE
ncbi:ATP-dependent DNA helicase [Thermophagus sp. OGC60D27]|uniref:ATP-dependent DNA helicase n=1 Tax=Thermophagus sp. OGC60D27 TaxID=3458415 RepID=UPI0040381CFF